jgi:hypothetical protein
MTPETTEEAQANAAMGPMQVIPEWGDMTMLEKLNMRFRGIRGWECERARAWEDEITSRKAIHRYQTLMKLQEEHKKGMVTWDEFRKDALGEQTEAEQAWEEAEIATETSRGRRKILMRDMISFKRTSVPTKDGGQQPVYAAVAARYWFGDRGASDMISASGFLYQPVLKSDQEDVLLEMKQKFRQQVAQEIQQRVGLEVSPNSPDLDRCEYLVIWEVDDQTVNRIRTYEQGWVRDTSKPLKEMTGKDISQLARRLGLTAPVKPHGTPLLVEAETTPDEERIAFNRARGLPDDA